MGLAHVIHADVRVDLVVVANAQVSSCDIVVDATDNLSTRYLISDCCVLADKPLVSGAALGFDGQVRLPTILLCVMLGVGSPR